MTPGKQFALALAVLVLAASTTGIQAQSQAARFPVIVVFDETADLQPFVGRFQPNARIAANPQAWSYLDYGVAGAVQALEAAHGFMADHVYGAALKGFAARLSAQQIAALEADPLVKYIEADGIMFAFAQTLPWGSTRSTPT